MTICILSPNLGCPEIVDPEDFNANGLPLILAVAEGDRPDWSVYSLKASPAYENQGLAFEIAVADPSALEETALPDELPDVRATRELIGTTLRAKLLPGHSFWRLRMLPSSPVGREHLRTVKGQPRATLYDLALLRGGMRVAQVHNALCLRLANAQVNFVHLTDLHVATRNDLWQAEMRSIITGNIQPRAQRIINFNEHLRTFIRWANDPADQGTLDLVLALGDLVDFVQIGLTQREPGDNNWTVLIDILIGSPREAHYNNRGLHVPLFTTTGNHDWRPLPYPPNATLDIFNMTKQCARELDYLYHDTTEEVAGRLEEVNNRLIAQGAPILARSWWGSVVSFGFRGLQVGLSRSWIRIKALAGQYLKSALLTIIAALAGGSTLWYLPHLPELGWGWLLVIAIVFFAVVGAFIVSGQVKAWLRRTLEELLALEADVDALADYFIKINPYFNYAFRLENCYFIVLDTGHDCLPAQSFWDDGGKKIQRVTIRDNMLGGSPDTMGFYPPNENYPYSQIAWLERVLNRIRREHDRGPDEARECRVFVGLHAPPANLSKSDRRRADKQLLSTGPFIMRPGHFRRFDIRYGTVNHYLSQFFYLCLGYREGQTDNISGPGVDVVFAGHAHWSVEFRLQRPDNPGPAWDPEIWYGKFSEEVERNTAPPDRWWGTLILQTGACGPSSPTDPNTPNFRYVTVDARMAICNLSVRTV